MLAGGSRTFFDAFAGMGGMRLGMESAGFKCSGFCEIDGKARETYKANFENSGSEHEDIRSVKRLPHRTDVLCAGFPCTPFSPIGKRRGFADTDSGRLFFEVARLMKSSRPKAVLLENVKALVHHDGGAVLDAILGKMRGLGYLTSWRMFNAADFGLPQRRERVFIVGFRSREFAGKFEFPEPPRIRNSIRSIIRESVGPEFDASRAMVVGYIAKLKQRGPGRGGRFLPALHTPDEISRTLTANGTIMLLDENRLRTMTPRECARLQGFPDKFKLPPYKTQAYKQIGNSVPVPVVTTIAQNILRAMRRKQKKEKA